MPTRCHLDSRYPQFSHLVLLTTCEVGADTFISMRLLCCAQNPTASSTSERRKEFLWGLPVSLRLLSPTSSLLTCEALLCTAHPWPCGLGAQLLSMGTPGAEHGQHRIQPGNRAKLPAHSQKPASGERLSQRAGVGGELSPGSTIGPDPIFVGELQRETLY